MNTAPTFPVEVVEHKGRIMQNKVGSSAVKFELKDTSGSVHRLQDYTGHWLLMVFHRHLG